MNAKCSPQLTVQAALGPKEELRWSQSLSRRAARNLNGVIQSARILSGVLTALAGLSTLVIPTVLRSFELWMFLPVLPLPLLAAFFWLFASWSSRHIQRTSLYAVTNQRLLILNAGSIQSFPYDGLGTIDVVRRGANAGDVLFAKEASGAFVGSDGFRIAVPLRRRIGFFDVTGVNEVEGLIARCQAQARPPSGAEAATPLVASGAPLGDAWPGPNELRFGRERPRRAEGYFLLLWGAFFVAISTIILVAGTGWGPILGVLIGLAGIAAGLWMLQWRDVLVLDRSARTYVRRRGWAPRLKEAAGSFADLESLHLQYESRGRNE